MSRQSLNLIPAAFAAVVLCGALLTSLAQSELSWRLVLPRLIWGGITHSFI
jgi:hypothetical protein